MNKLIELLRNNGDDITVSIELLSSGVPSKVRIYVEVRKFHIGEASYENTEAIEKSCGDLVALHIEAIASRLVKAVALIEAAGDVKQS